MFILRYLLLGIFALTTSGLAEDSADLDYVLANLTALWQEVNELKKEINYHSHRGHLKDDGIGVEQVLEEIKTLAHEHHVHHLQHSHEDHELHHNQEMQEHLETAHNHEAHHHETDHHGRDDHDHHHSSHDHHGREDSEESEEHDSDEDARSSSGGRRPGLQDNCGDPGRFERRRSDSRTSNCGSHGSSSGGSRSGLQDNCGDPGRFERRRSGSRTSNCGKHGSHGHGGRGKHRGHGHKSFGTHGSKSKDSHEDHAHERSHGHGDTHDFHGLKKKTSGHVLIDAHQYPSDHYDGDAHVGTHTHAFCQMKVNHNYDHYRSDFKGRIDVSIKESGVAFFDVDFTGLEKEPPRYKTYMLELYNTSADCQECTQSNCPIYELVETGAIHTIDIGEFEADDDGKADNVIFNTPGVTMDDVIGKTIMVKMQKFGASGALEIFYFGACCDVIPSP